MDLKNIVIDTSKSTGNLLICVGVKPQNEYVNGQKTDVVKCHTYEIVMPEKNFDKLNVKIEGGNRLGDLDGGNCEVKIENLEIHVNLVQGKLYVTGKATNIRRTDQSNK